MSLKAWVPPLYRSGPSQDSAAVGEDCPSWKEEDPKLVSERALLSGTGLGLAAVELCLLAEEGPTLGAGGEATPAPPLLKEWGWITNTRPVLLAARPKNSFVVFTYDDRAKREFWTVSIIVKRKKMRFFELFKARWVDFSLVCFEIKLPCENSAFPL
jgi:hypothetical protein